MYSPTKPNSDVSLDLARFLISGKTPRAARRAPEACEDHSGKRRFLGRFLRKQDGAIAAMSAFSVVAILGFSGFAVDLSHANSERDHPQVTASATALAAAPERPSRASAWDEAEHRGYDL